MEDAYLRSSKRSWGLIFLLTSPPFEKCPLLARLSFAAPDLQARQGHKSRSAIMHVLCKLALNSKWAQGWHVIARARRSRLTHAYAIPNCYHCNLHSAYMQRSPCDSTTLSQRCQYIRARISLTSSSLSRNPGNPSVHFQKTISSSLSLLAGLAHLRLQAISDPYQYEAVRTHHPKYDPKLTIFLQRTNCHSVALKAQSSPVANEW